MRKYSTVFLIIAIITGAIGFTGLNFEGIAIPRVLFLIFTDLFVVSIIAKAFFSDERRLKLQKIPR